MSSAQDRAHWDWLYIGAKGNSRVYLTIHDSKEPLVVGGLFSCLNSLPPSSSSAYNRPKLHQDLPKQHATGLCLEDRMPGIGRTISHYKIAEKIGYGGSGEVYKAHSEENDL